MEDQSRLRRSTTPSAGLGSGLRFDCGEFGFGSGREIGLKSVLDHGGVRGGNKIEMGGLIGMHEGSCS